MSCADAGWGREGKPLLSVEAAWDDLASQVTPGPITSVAIHECDGLFLAEPVIAVDDYPPFDKAMMDGFAVRSADCTTPDVTLRVIGLIAAGQSSDQKLAHGEAMQINTGAPLPPGADAVVMVEKTRIATDAKSVFLQVSAKAGENVEARGSVRRAAQPILGPPVRLNAGAIAAAATAGAATVRVRARPTCGIVLTGDEIVPAGSPRGAGKIFDSNGPMLAALMRQLGATAAEPVHAPDELSALADRLRAAMTHPIVLAVGGMSMGTLDLVPAAFESLGVRWRWHGVAMRPGRPVAYGRGHEGQHVFGLPGNPVSAFVCSWLFVKPVIDGLQGLPASPPPNQSAVLNADLKPNRDPRPAFTPARTWTAKDGRILIEPCAWQGSSDSFGLAEANALLVRPNPAEATPRGATISYIRIADA